MKTEPRPGNADPSAAIIKQDIKGIGLALAAGEFAVQKPDGHGMDGEEPGAGSQQARNHGRDGRDEEEPDGKAEDPGGGHENIPAAHAGAQVAGQGPHEKAQDIDKIGQGDHAGGKMKGRGCQAVGQEIENGLEHQKPGSTAGNGPEQVPAGQEGKEPGLFPG